MVEIEKFVERKPFLGGYRHKLIDVAYHNAKTQKNRELPKQTQKNDKQSRDSQVSVLIKAVVLVLDKWTCIELFEKVKPQEF